MSELLFGKADVRTPVRNRWFYGKLLDAYHMELETDYGSRKRWLLNRLVLGSGVAIGLDVKQAGPLAVAVTHGVAIDWHGREILVPEKLTAEKTIPETVIRDAMKAQKVRSTDKSTKKPARDGGKYGQRRDEDGFVWVQVRIGFQSRSADPVPVEFGSDCGGGDCAPGSIHEGYEIHFAPERGHRVACGCRMGPKQWEDIEYGDLVRWVTRERPAKEFLPHQDPSIILANVLIDVSDTDPKKWKICPDEIDIEVRPIVFYNDLLYQLFANLNDTLGE